MRDESYDSMKESKHLSGETVVLTNIYLHYFFTTKNTFHSSTFLVKG